MGMCYTMVNLYPLGLPKEWEKAWEYTLTHPDGNVWRDNILQLIKDGVIDTQFSPSFVFSGDIELYYKAYEDALLNGHNAHYSSIIINEVRKVQVVLEQTTRGSPAYFGHPSELSEIITECMPRIQCRHVTESQCEYRWY